MRSSRWRQNPIFVAPVMRTADCEWYVGGVWYGMVPGEEQSMVLIGMVGMVLYT